MATDKKVPALDPNDIPEVQRFITEQERFEQFRQQNKQFFDYLEQLAAAHNEALNAARAACKQRGVSCGPIQATSVSTKYDADAMYDLFGRETFLELGGSLETVQQRSLDKKRVDFNIDSGRIDADRAALIRKESVSYKKNEEISIPGSK
jgi:hypothetical protein